MKKYIVLFSVTLLVIAAILLVGFTGETPPIAVTVATLSEQEVQLSVSCNGVVGPKNRYNIFATYPCVVDHVAVKEGDPVQKGDVLFTVNDAATRRLLTAAKKYSEETIEAAATTSLVAPVNGIITSVGVGDGGTVDNTKPAFTMSGTDALEVAVEVAEKDVGAVFVGQEALITGNGFARDCYHGTVARISSLAHTNGGTTTVSVVIALDETELDRSLRLGLSAKVQLITDRLNGRLVVPYEWVLEDEENREYVYVAENGQAIKRVIATEAELSDGLLITSGLTAFDRVITNPQDIPHDGAAVTEATGE